MHLSPFSDTEIENMTLKWFPGTLGVYVLPLLELIFLLCSRVKTSGVDSILSRFMLSSASSLLYISNLFIDLPKVDVINWLFQLDINTCFDL